MSAPRGQWVRKPTPKSNAAVVFVHGILSDGDTSWRSGDGDIYWPELLSREQQIGEIGVYVFSYRADVFSAGYSLGDAVVALNTYLELDKLLELQNLIFVCHSMGGIVVRRFLVKYQVALIKKDIHVGLVLVASPSLGSDYANLFLVLAIALGNSQAQALRFSDNNRWLNDLDHDFRSLKESGLLFLRGRELVEDEFIVLHRFLRRQVVRPFSGACYFDASIRIPNSNHSTIAKPTGPDALQHRLLLQFVVKFLQSPTAEVTGAESPITTIYDLSLKYAEEAFDEVKRIFGEAYTWVERGIGAGSSSAMYFLGQCYFEGSGVQQDVNEAFGWFEKAAMAGDVDAMYKVAVMYKEGVGVPLNLEKFHEWINKAADLGHKDAIESRSKASSTS